MYVCVCVGGGGRDENKVGNLNTLYMDSIPFLCFTCFETSYFLY